jgi:L-ribulose-5-phosphate 4-epimerase
MKEQLKQEVLEANLKLQSSGLVIFTWGNVSAIDRESGEVIIKPSGVPYERLGVADLVIVDLDARVLEGTLKPSSDLMTHLEIYRHFPECLSVVHTHSRMATAWAQAGRDIPALGTTHADYFYGSIPCTRNLSEDEICGAYEAETGKVIVETFALRHIDPTAVPGVLVHSHGPFTWGENPRESIHNAIVLEEIATMAWHTLTLAPKTGSVDQYLLDRHYLRKHGNAAYYGQS